MLVFLLQYNISLILNTQFFLEIMSPLKQTDISVKMIKTKSQQSFKDQKLYQNVTNYYFDFIFQKKKKKKKSRIG